MRLRGEAKQLDGLSPMLLQSCEINNNNIQYDGPPFEIATPEFRGTGNRLIVAPNIRKCNIKVKFLGNDSTVSIGNAFLADVRIELGDNCICHIGDNVGPANNLFLDVARNNKIEIGDDCLIASDVQLRAHDGHLIFDINSGELINPPKSIILHNHVWLGNGCMILGGSRIGQGSIIGARSLVKGMIPARCTAAGIPAKVLRTGVTWERANFNYNKDEIDDWLSGVKRSKYRPAPRR